MQDGGGGEQYVQGGADQAEDLPVEPAAGGQRDGSEGHDQQGHQEVGQSQRHDEVVSLLPPEERRDEERSRGERRGGERREMMEEERGGKKRKRRRETEEQGTE